jgi:hypothetical protein
MVAELAQEGAELGPAHQKLRIGDPVRPVSLASPPAPLTAKPPASEPAIDCPESPKFSISGTWIDRKFQSDAESPVQCAACPPLGNFDGLAVNVW